MEIEVRATIRVLDLAPGEIVRVDTDDPYIAGLLRAGWLVPTTKNRRKKKEAAT